MRDPVEFTLEQRVSQEANFAGRLTNLACYSLSARIVPSQRRTEGLPWRSLIPIGPCAVSLGVMSNDHQCCRFLVLVPCLTLLHEHLNTSLKVTGAATRDGEGRGEEEQHAISISRRQQTSHFSGKSIMSLKGPDRVEYPHRAAAPSRRETDTQHKEGPKWRHGRHKTHVLFHNTIR